MRDEEIMKKAIYKHYTKETAWVVERNNEAKRMLEEAIQLARKDERRKIIERLQKHFEARKQQTEKLGGKYNLGRVVGIGECMRIIKKEMSKDE